MWHRKLLILALWPLCASADFFNYSPKLDIRLSNGVFSNETGGLGSARTIGGLNVGGQYFFNRMTSLGIHYQFHFDMSTHAVVLSSFDISNHWYFWGAGTRGRLESGNETSDYQDGFGLYLGVELARRTLFLGVNTNPNLTPISVSETGESYSVNVALGGDFHLSRHLDLTAEGNYSVFNFAATDARFRITAFLVHAGISYVW